MVNFCIVEDDEIAARELESFIRRYCVAIDTEFKVSGYRSAVSFLNNYGGGFDIIFMDIDLPGLNGMDAVKKLRDADESAMVIFVTNLKQYAVGGYEVGAFDFVVKPIVYSNFVLKLRRALGALHAKRGREIWVPTRAGKKLIDCSRLMYVEVMKHVISYHTTAETVVGSGTLKSVCENLEGLPFSLCNRCYLVNLSFVTEINGNFVTVGKEKLLISVPRRKEFLRSFNDFLGAGG